MTANKEKYTVADLFTDLNKSNLRDYTITFLHPPMKYDFLHITKVHGDDLIDRESITIDAEEERIFVQLL